MQGKKGSKAPDDETVRVDDEQVGNVSVWLKCCVQHNGPNPEDDYNEDCNQDGDNDDNIEYDVFGVGQQL